LKIYRILLFCLFTVLLAPLESEAQRDVYNWQITPYAGLLTINNDIALPKDANTYAYGLRVERRFGNDFTLGLHVANLDLGDAVRKNISGGFLSLGYHWDNGYLLSQRSFLSIFHRLEIGYADRYSSFESISGKSADFAIGFENGLKFRLGDRVSADLALELFSSKTNLTTGDIAENIRYNVWKAGITYHFGNRKSNYVAPVFVPRTGIPSQLDKIEIQDESIWVVKDTVYNDELILETPESTKSDTVMVPRLTRADSMLIFMRFDSLYQRRILVDTTAFVADSIVLDSARIDSIPIQEYDSLKTLDSEPVDSTQYIPRTSDSLISPIDTAQYMGTAAVIIEADSLRPDTLSGMKQAGVDSSAGSIPVVADTVVILKTDTVYMERPEPENIDQKRDTTRQSSIIGTEQGRVDTVYIVKDAAETRQTTTAEKDRTAKDRTTKTGKDRDDLTQEQNARISSLESEIDRLKKQNKRNNAGKVVAAGAAGAVLGSVLSHDKKPDKDTVYVANIEDTSRIDSLQNELDSLKRMYGIAVVPVSGSDTIVDPPIGMYFAGSDSTSALLPDSTYVMEVDSLGLKPDSLSALDEAVLNQTLVQTASDSLGIADSTAVPIEITSPDTSVVPVVSAEEPDKKEAEPSDKIDLPALTAEYPVSCNFGLNKVNLTDEELVKLDAVLFDLKNDESRRAMLTGYTDRSGNADYNLQLSEKRANFVREYLVSKGIDAKRIDINAGGVLSSAERYSPDARRVEVMIVENE